MLIQEFELELYKFWLIFFFLFTVKNLMPPIFKTHIFWILLPSLWLVLMRNHFSCRILEISAPLHTLDLSAVRFNAGKCLSSAWTDWSFMILVWLLRSTTLCPSLVLFWKYTAADSVSHQHSVRDTTYCRLLLLYNLQIPLLHPDIFFFLLTTTLQKHLSCVWGYFSAF